MLNGILKGGVLLIMSAMPALAACITPIDPAARAGSGAEAICEIARLPPGRAGRTVTLEAEFTTDRRHGGFLHDQRCPGIVVLPYDSQRTVRDGVYEAFLRAIYDDPLTLGPVTTNVTLFGVIRPTGPRNYRLDVIRYIDSRRR